MTHTAIGNTLQRFMAAILKSARFTKRKQPTVELLTSHPLIRCAAIMALGTPRNQCCSMFCHPGNQWMSNRNSMTNLILEITSQCAHVTLQQFDSHLCRSVGLWVILWAVLLEDL